MDVYADKNKLKLNTDKTIAMILKIINLYIDTSVHKTISDLNVVILII